MTGVDDGWLAWAAGVLPGAVLAGLLLRLHRPTGPDPHNRSGRPAITSGPDRQRRTALLLMGLVLILVGPFIQTYNAQTAARYALTAAIYDDHTILLDDYEQALGIDRVEREGHILSDKAPGQPFAAVPFYVLACAVGAEPATVLRAEGNLGVWWVTLWSSVLPGAILAALLYGHARRWYPDRAAVASLSLVFATLLLPLISDLHGHVLAATLAFGAWTLLSPPRAGWSRPLIAGMLMGGGIAVEYPVGLIAAVAGGWLLSRSRWRELVLFVIGVAPSLGLLLWYQSVAFGHPFRTSYQEKTASPGLAQLPADWWPEPTAVIEVLLGSRGLIYTPIVLVGTWFALRLARQGSEATRQEAVTALVLFGLFLWLQASWVNPWGGALPGPRYMVSALPFLVVPVAAAGRAMSTSLHVIIGAALMTLALVTQTLVHGDANVIAALLRNLWHTGLTPTVFTVALGPWGWLLHLVLGAWITRLTWKAVRSEVSSSSLRRADHGATP